MSLGRRRGRPVRGAVVIATPTTVIDLPPLPAIVRARVNHRRHRPIVHDVKARTSPWLVDVDRLPSHWPTATFRREDHLSDGDDTLREACWRPRPSTVRPPTSATGS